MVTPQNIISNGDGWHALYNNLLARRWDGYGVVDGVGNECAPSAGSNDMEVDVNDGDVFVAGSQVSFDTATSPTSHDVGGSDPRFDVGYIDANGDLQVAKGTANPIQSDQTGLQNFKLYYPNIPDLSAITGTPIYAVYIPAGFNSTFTGVGTDIRDLRVPSKSNVHDLAAEQIVGGVASSNTITDLAGDGLEVISNALRASLGAGLEFSAGSIQLLSTIWDGSDIVADVNNSLVTTDDGEVNNAPSGDNDILRWQEGVEVGSVTSSGTDNSGGNNDWGQSTSSTTTETFDSAFGVSPNIGTSLDNDADNESAYNYKVSVNNVSTTGFDMRFDTMVAQDLSGRTLAGHYVASEGR